MITNKKIIFIQPFFHFSNGHFSYSLNSYLRTFDARAWTPTFSFKINFFNYLYISFWLFIALNYSLYRSFFNKNITFVLLDYHYKHTLLLFLFAHKNLYVNVTELTKPHLLKLNILKKIQLRTNLFGHTKTGIIYYAKNGVKNIFHWPSPDINFSDVFGYLDKIDIKKPYQIIPARHLSLFELKKLIRKINIKKNIIVLPNPKYLKTLKKNYLSITFYPYIQENFLLYLIYSSDSLIIPYQKNINGESSFLKLAKVFSKKIYFIDKEYDGFKSLNYQKKYLINLN